MTKESALKDKVAIVTGASAGFGVGIAKALREAGAKVWIVARSKEKLEEVAAQLGATAFPGDVTDPQMWDQLMKKVEEEDGRLDILVNNAGGGITIKEITEQTDEDVLQSISLNLTSVILGSKRAAKVMKGRKSGIIIQVSSLCSQQCWVGWNIYGAAKAGMEVFNKGLYLEMRPHNVRATTIIPAWGSTDFTKAANLPDFDPETIKKMITPDDFGRLVYDICTMPEHLVIPEVTLLPLVQEIHPY